MPSSTRRDATGRRYATRPPARQSLLRLLPKRLRGYACERKVSNMDYYSIGWRDNNDGQGQAYHDVTDREDNNPMNTQQAKHTPIPWSHIGVNIYKFGDSPADKRIIACCDYQQTASGGSKNANVEFICRAVNNHDVLLKALQALYHDAQKGFAHVEHMTQARAAIQAATKGGV